MLTLATTQQGQIEPREPAAVTPSDESPAAVYLASLATGSRETMRGALQAIAQLLSDRQHDIRTMPWHTLEYQHAALVKSELTNNGYAPATVNKYLAALKGTMKAAWSMQQMDSDQYLRICGVNGLKATRLPTGRALSEMELNRLFLACEADMQQSPAKATRDAAILAVLYSVAAPRRSEWAKLDLSDYDRETGQLTIRSGKGDNDRLGFLAGRHQEALEVWLKWRGLEPGPLFKPIGKSGAIKDLRIAPQSLYVILRERARQAGLKDFSPHDVRRTAISSMLDNGTDLATVSKSVGHSQISTTASYDRCSERAIRSAAEALQLPNRR